jgi:hypothetical protein
LHKLRVLLPDCYFPNWNLAITYGAGCCSEYFSNSFTVTISDTELPTIVGTSCISLLLIQREFVVKQSLGLRLLLQNCAGSSVHKLRSLRVLLSQLGLQLLWGAGCCFEYFSNSFTVTITDTENQLLWTSCYILLLIQRSLW